MKIRDNDWVKKVKEITATKETEENKEYKIMTFLDNMSKCIVLSHTFPIIIC